MVILVLQEKYYLIVSGAFDREPIIFDKYPSDEEIIQAIKDKKGSSAKIEKRYTLKEGE